MIDERDDKNTNVQFQNRKERFNNTGRYEWSTRTFRFQVRNYSMPETYI